MRKIADFLFAKETIPRWFYWLIIIIVFWNVIQGFIENWSDSSIKLLIILPFVVVIIWLENRYERRTER